MTDEGLCGEEADVVSGAVVVVPEETLSGLVALRGKMTASEKRWCLRYLMAVQSAFDQYRREGMQDFATVFADLGHRPMTVREREMLGAFGAGWAEAFADMMDVLRG